jgi:predicted nucleic acid-binding protein
MIHLDTNFLIQALLPGSAAEARLLAWPTAEKDFAVSTIVSSEFLSGPLTPQDELLATEHQPHRPLG